MSIQQLPSGRYRAQVDVDGRNVGVGKVIGGPSTFDTKRAAKIAREKAREAKADLGAGGRGVLTVRAWRDRWLSEPRWRPNGKPRKESTLIRYREATAAFVEQLGGAQLRAIDDEAALDWLAGASGRAHAVEALRVMWNDAASASAGRLVDARLNPWAGLGIGKGDGNRRKSPPDEATVWGLVNAARSLSGPYLAAWLQVAAFTGMRPGELDALRWEHVDLDAGRLHVVEQFSAATRTFTTPKNGNRRDALLTPPARDALIALPRDPSGYAFVNLRGKHLTPSSRAYHWRSIRAAAGWGGTLYLATRHFAGWYMVNVLELPSEDVAIALGHEDGGELVRTLYGHRDHGRALDRVQAAYQRAGNVRPLRVVDHREVS